MLSWLECNVAAFAAAIFLSGLLIPRILHIARIRKLYDQTGGRKIHRGYVPRLGGVAFFPAILFSMCLVLAVNLSYEAFFADFEMYVNGVGLLYLTCAGTLLFLVGIADDLVGVRYRAKFVLQIMAAALIIVSGTYVSNLSGLLWIWQIPVWVSWILTALLVVYVVNAINLIDGIDGLATGLSMIALIFYGIVLYLAGSHIYSMLAFAGLGTLLPFFYFNVFGRAERGKKIFMGDTGSLTVGVILAFLAVAVSALPEGEMTDGFNPMVLAFAPLIIPGFDVVRVIIHRVSNKRNPFLPNNVHIHHKLLYLGYSQRVALGTILGGSVIFLVVNVLLSPYVQVTLLLAGDVLVWTTVNIAMTKAIKRREKKVGHKLYD